MTSEDRSELVVGVILGALAMGILGVIAYPEPAPAPKNPAPITQEPERFPAVATWYGKAYAGRKTASGERFDPADLTAAHPTLPFGTLVLVRWIDRKTVVRVTDRPAPGVDVLDLSSKAFEQLAPLRVGRIHVTCEVLQ